jgi:hypothetical protein
MMEQSNRFTVEVKTKLQIYRPLKLTIFVKLHGLFGVCSRAAVNEKFTEG